MEKTKIRELRDNINKAKSKMVDPVQKDYLWKMEMSVKTCPPQFLRITKMNKHVEEIMKDTTLTK